MGLSISRNQLEEDKEYNLDNNGFYDFWNFYLDYDINF